MLGVVGDLRHHGSGCGRTSVRGALVIGALGVLVLVGMARPARSGVRTTNGESVPSEVVVVELDRSIDKVTSRFLSRALDDAADRGAELVIVRLDTPGGLATATRDMVRDIFASRIPVVVYVAPEGSRAASAGTFVAASAGVAAMAPATNIGAASAVGGQGEDLPKTLKRKANEDAAALLRSIAERRGRNAAALEAAVFEAKAYSAEQAVELGIVDLVADDLDDLLAQLDGREIPVRGSVVTVDTDDLRVRHVDLNWFEEILAFLSDPTLAFLLLSLGGLGLVIEILHFGAVVPGVVGLVLLVLGFAGVGQLPFSWAGVAMIGLALALFLAEAHAPGFGFFGIVGVGALVLGGLFLVGFFGSPGLPGSPEFRVNRAVIIGVGAAVGLIVGALTWQLRRAATIPGYQSPYRRDAIVGQVGRVTRRLDPVGEVHVAGEFWGATLPAGETAEADETVRVTGSTGLTLHVERIDQREGQRQWPS
jgi:membrane-bound serine protease (ClpP class)